MPKTAIEELEKDRVQVNAGAEVSCSVEKLLQQKNIEFLRYKIRNTQRGMLVIDFATVKVFINSKDNPMPREHWILIRKEIDGTGMKFTLSNSPVDTSLEVLAER